MDQSPESAENNPNPAEGARPPREHRSPVGGVIHTYQKYDPKSFPSPTAPPPDLASAAFEHMLAYGSMRNFTEEELRNAVRIDPSMFPALGPGIEAMSNMLEDRKRKILSTYETDTVQLTAEREFRERANDVSPPAKFANEYFSAVREQQIGDFESLYTRQKDEQSQFARDLMGVTRTLGNKYEVDELAAKYRFTGREELSVEEAIAAKEELEAIDRLLEQLKQAAQTAQLGIIDFGELSQFGEDDADRERIEALNQLQQQIEDYLQEQARAQGLEMTRQGYRLSPQAYRIFQRKLLTEIFSDLQAARSGRHSGPIVGEGAVEMERTRAYEFGDAASTMNVTQSIINAAARSGRAGADRAGPREDARPTRVESEDIEIHLTKNNPKCATSVLMDMSGSMRHGGQYIHCKRMALALDGLIRSEYPGDFLRFFEMYSFAKPRHVSELPALMPKPVSIHQPVVRLKADTSDPDLSEMRIPQHFTNIQHALRLSRLALAAQDTPNRQIILITDGLPTAHFEGPILYLLYPPGPRTEAETMREAMLCKRHGITINIFLLPSWSQSSEDIQFAQRMAQTTGGRVFFTGGKDLDRFVLWDYVKMRRKIIG